jgi:preprotein translocase subunit YajC
MYIIEFLFSTQNRMSIILLFFQDAGSGGSIFGSIGIFLPILVMVGIFYFLVMLPQKRQRQQLQDLIAQLKINDEIVTNGGVIGKIKEVKETSFIIQSAEKSFIEIGKSAVIGKRPE